MPAQEIPRQEWIGFCQSFTRQHQGSLVTLEIGRPGEEPSVETQSLPFQRISLDTNGTGSEALHITVGRAMEEHLIHLGPQTMRVLFDESDAGTGLMLEKRDGTQTRLRFGTSLPQDSRDALRMPPE